MTGKKNAGKKVGGVVLESNEEKVVKPEVKPDAKGINVLDSNGVLVRIFSAKEQDKAEYYAKKIGGRIARVAK